MTDRGKRHFVESEACPTSNLDPANFAIGRDVRQYINSSFRFGAGRALRVFGPEPLCSDSIGIIGCFLDYRFVRMDYQFSFTAFIFLRSSDCDNTAVLNFGSRELLQ